MKSITLLKLQCSQLGLLVALSQEPKRWGERTVIMRKGQLTSVGGEIMPKNPPAFRILTPEQWIRFTQGDIKNFRDIDRRRDQETGYMAALSSLSSIFTGLKKIDQDGQINKIIQSVFQGENKNEIIDNIVATSPVKDENFIEGLTTSIDVVSSDSVNFFDNIVNEIIGIAHSTEELVQNLKYLTASKELLIQGVITGGLLVAGTAAAVALDFATLAMFGSLIPGIRNLAIVKKLSDPFIGFILKRMNLTGNKAIDRVIAIITSKISMRLALIPVSLLAGIAFQHLKELEVAGKRIVDVQKTLPKDFFKGKDITPESRADQVIAIAEETINDLGLDKKKIKERLIAENQRPVTHIVNTKYTLERRLIELDYLHKEQKIGLWSKIPGWKEKERGVWEKAPLYSLLTPEKESQREILKGYEVNNPSNTSVRNLSEEQRKQSYIWHKGIVEAELKYGDSIDDLVSSNQLNEKNKYNSLLKKVSDGKSAADPVAHINKKISLSFRVSDDDVNPLAKQRIVNVAKQAQEILSMSNVQPNVEVGSFPSYPRPFYYAYEWYKKTVEGKIRQLLPYIQEKDLNLKTGDGIINAGNRLFGSDRFVGFHETGHAIEIKAGLVDVSKNYIDSRQISSKEMLLKDDGRGRAFEKSETYIPTDFVDQYTSKKYDYATELTSMSVQNLANPSLLKNACKEDREHILYGLWVLDYKPQG